VPAPVVKKAREAKKLGKKIGQKKAKLAAQEADHSGSEDVDMGSSVYSDRSMTSKARTVSVASTQKEPVQAEGWGRGDDESAPADVVNGQHDSIPPPPRPSSRSKPSQDVRSSTLASQRTHTVVKEEKVTFRDTYLVSKSCRLLVDLVRQCLDEATALHATDNLPPHFAESAYNLVTAASAVLTLFRALIFASPHVADVPTLGMQLSNDCAWIAEHLPTSDANADEKRAEGYTLGSEGGAGHAKAALPKWDNEAAVALMQSASVHAYESQLAVQREGIVKVLADLPELGDVGDDVQLKAAMRVVQEVKGIIDSLGRVWKVCITRSRAYQCAC
jgi:hypothetical protein